MYLGVLLFLGYSSVAVRLRQADVFLPSDPNHWNDHHSELLKLKDSEHMALIL